MYIEIERKMCKSFFFRWYLWGGVSLLLLMFFSFPQRVCAQSRCHKCGGSGQMVIFSDKMSNFGLSKTKRQCPICHEWFIGEHSEPCDQCGGAGFVTSSTDRIHESMEARSDEALLNGLRTLTPGEMAQYRNYQEMLKGHREAVSCKVCQGSGICIICHQTGYVENGLIVCPSCGGIGRCAHCGGSGEEAYSKLVLPSPEEQREILDKMNTLLVNGMNRSQGTTGVQTVEVAKEDVVEEKQRKGGFLLQKYLELKGQKDADDADDEDDDDDGMAWWQWVLCIIGGIAVIRFVISFFDD